jgi:hypothetical protein
MRFEVFILELSIHVLSERLFGCGEHLWNLLSADGFNQAKKAALDVLVVISKKFIDVFVKVLMYSNDHPLGIHLEKKQESQNGLTTENDRLIL